MRASRCVPRRLHPRVVADRHRERGSTSIQMVVLMPALFALMFMGMQAALIYHARTIAIAAAEEGARAAGAQGGSVSGGTAAAAAFVASAGGGDVLRSVSATGNRGAATATVTVSGAALSVVPGWSPRITQSATVPVERLSR